MTDVDTAVFRCSQSPLWWFTDVLNTYMIQKTGIPDWDLEIDPYNFSTPWRRIPDLIYINLIYAIVKLLGKSPQARHNVVLWRIPVKITGRNTGHRNTESQVTSAEDNHLDVYKNKPPNITNIIRDCYIFTFEIWTEMGKERKKRKWKKFQ